jgi:hypothetical protein
MSRRTFISTYGRPVAIVSSVILRVSRQALEMCNPCIRLRLIVQLFVLVVAPCRRKLQHLRIIGTGVHVRIYLVSMR